MAFWELNGIQHIVVGLLADLPAAPENSRHAYYAYDEGVLYVSAVLTPTWASIGGSFDPLLHSLAPGAFDVAAGQQVIFAGELSGAGTVTLSGSLVVAG